MEPSAIPTIHALAEPRVFERRSRDHSVWQLVGGLLMIGVAAGGFVLALRRDVGPFRLQTMTTVPMLGGLALITRAWQGRNRLRMVMIDATGLTLINRAGTRHLPWTDIAWNSESLQPVTNVQRCRVYGADGGVLASIPAVVDGFGELVALINRRVKSNPTALAEQVRRARLRRQSPLAIGFGLLLLAALTFLVWSDHDDRRREQLLATASVQGLATIERKFVAPDGHTKRVEYRVDARRADGTAPDTVNAELEPMLWDALSEGMKFSVRYVPAEPDVSRLTFGQRSDGPDLDPIMKLLLFGGGGVFAMVMLVFGILNRFGIDLVIDSETKRPRISRGVAK